MKTVIIALVFAISFLPGIETVAGKKETASVNMEVKGGGAGSVWIANRVDVLLFVRPEWVLPIEDAFAELKGISPKRMPRFNVRNMGREDCKPKPRDYKRPVMVICSTYTPDGWTGATSAMQEHHTIDEHGVKIWYDNGVLEAMLNAPESTFYLNQFLNLIRHELMHGVSWVNDCYGCRPTTSAVHGDLPYFGPWDQKFIKKAYRKHDGRDDRKDAKRGKRNRR